MRRWGKPEDFGAIAVYLVSDASTYHTDGLVSLAAVSVAYALAVLVRALNA